MKTVVADIEDFGDHSLLGWWINSGRPRLEKRLYVKIGCAPVSCVINDIHALRAIAVKHPELVSPRLIIEISPFKERADLFPINWDICNSNR